MSRSRRTLLNNLCRELESRGILDDERGCGNVQKGSDPYRVQELFVAAQRDGIRLSNSGRRLVNVSKPSSRLGREANYGLTDLVDEDIRWAAENNPGVLLSSNGSTLNQIFGMPAAPSVSLSSLFQPTSMPPASFPGPSASQNFVAPPPASPSFVPPPPPSPSFASPPPPPPPPPPPSSSTPPPPSTSVPPPPPPPPSTFAPPPPPPPPSGISQPKKTPPPPSSSSKKAPPSTVKSPPSNLELLSKLQVLKKVDQTAESKPPAAPSNPQEVMLAELRKKAAAAKERRGSATEESNKAEEARQKARQSAVTLFQKKTVSSDLESVIKRRTSLGGFESDLKRTYSLEAVKAQCEEFTDEDSCEAKHCSWEEGDEDWDEGSGCKAYEPPEWLISDRDIFALQDNYDDITYVDIVEDHAKEWTQAIENELNLVSHAWRQEGLKGGKAVPLSDVELANVAIWDIWEKRGETNARFKALRKALESYDETSWSFPLFIDKILAQVDPSYDWYQCVDRIDCSAQVLYRIASNQIWDTLENEIEQEAAKRKQLLAAGQDELVQTVGQEAATQAATELKMAENRLSELQESGARLTGDLAAARTAKSELESQLVTALANKSNATVLEIESGLKTYDKLIDQFSQQLTEVESNISSLLGN